MRTRAGAAGNGILSAALAQRLAEPLFRGQCGPVVEPVLDRTVDANFCVREWADAAGADLHLLHAYLMPSMYYGTPMGSAVVYPYTIEDEKKRDAKKD